MERKIVSNRDELFDFLHNEKVAVVCNGPCLLEKNDGALIDTFDVVIRFNKGYPDVKPESTGRRTDIALILDKSCDKSRYGQGCIVLGASNMFGLEDSDVDLMMRPIWTDSILNYKTSSASSALVMICIAIDAGVKSIDVFGHDPGVTKNYYCNNDVSGIHDYKAEDEYYSKYAKDNGIEIAFH